MKKYQNELIALLALLLMLGAMLYKDIKVSSVSEKAVQMEHSINELKEIVSLKNVWANKKISKRVSKLEKLIPSSKMKWSKKGKKLTVRYEELSSEELNNLISKILNLPTQIQFLDIQKSGLYYNVEFKCKW